MRLTKWLAGLALIFCAGSAFADQGTHTVMEGQTLGRIASRYHISIEALCKANHMSRRDKIRPGQKLLIPSLESSREAADPEKGDETPEEPESKGDAKPEASESPAPQPAVAKDKDDDVRLPGGLRMLSLPGGNHAYYYEPTGNGRHSLKPIIVYLHGRGGHPDKDCQRWAAIARPLGWLVCPVGPIEYNGGRAWNNNWTLAHSITMQTIAGLRERFGRRVQLWGNTLIGFSEGAYAAMNVGVREPRTFNRWLILAANSTYWGGPGLEALQTARERVRRVYLITGERDEVVEGTHQVEAWLRKAGVTTRVTTPDDMGHEVALERKPGLYVDALRWLDRGAPTKKSGGSATASR